MVIDDIVGDVVATNTVVVVEIAIVLVDIYIVTVVDM